MKIKKWPFSIFRWGHIVSFSFIVYVKNHLILGMHIGYNHFRVGTKTIEVEPRDVIQLSMQGWRKVRNSVWGALIKTFPEKVGGAKAPL